MLKMEEPAEDGVGRVGDGGRSQRRNERGKILKSRGTDERNGQKGRCDERGSRSEEVGNVGRARGSGKRAKEENTARSVVAGAFEAGSSARGNFNNPRDTKRNVCSHIWPGLMRRQFSVYVGPPSVRGRKITIAGKRLRGVAGKRREDGDSGERDEDGAAESRI